MIIDSHAHLNLGKLKPIQKEAIERAEKAGVSFINIGTDIKTTEGSIEIAKKFSNCLGATVGLHPHDVPKRGFEVQDYRELVENNKNHILAIGEVGFDFYRCAIDDVNERELQKKALLKFIGLAKEFELPMVFHLRGHNDKPNEPYEMLYGVLEDENYFQGVLHCYGGNLEYAKKFVEKGLYIGITGIVTFNSAQGTHEIAREIPLKSILIETDCPFLAPEPHRGKVNEPAYVIHVAERIADIKNISYDDVIHTTTQNVKSLFKL